MTNRGIGNCWKALPDQEKKVWEVRAKKAKAEHKEMYPNYRFKPVHNKNKNKNKKEKLPTDEPDERRCEEVAQLLLEGKKGEELAAAVQRLDLHRKRDVTGSLSPMPFAAPLGMSSAPSHLKHRRSSSVPPSIPMQWDAWSQVYNPIAIPTVPSLALGYSPSRPASPVNNIARLHRGQEIALRRPSSAGPSYLNTWAPAAPFSLSDLQHDTEPLPDIDTTLFNPNFFTQNADFSSLSAPQPTVAFGGIGQVMTDPNSSWAQVDHTANPALGLSISPLEGSADPLTSALSSASSAFPYSAITPADGLQSMPWQAHDERAPSASPSGYSTTPPPDFEGHADMGLGLYATPVDPSQECITQWQQQQQSGVMPTDGAVGHDGFVYSHEADYIDPHAHLRDYAYGVEQYSANANCALESEGYTFTDPSMHYAHHPVEIPQF